MKFKVQALMRSHPEFDVQGKLNPMEVDLGLQGALSATIGVISGAVGEIPVRFQIPFLHRRRVVASVGGFNVTLKPVEIQIEKAGMHVKGMFGAGGIQGAVQGKVNCQTEMDTHGHFSGKAGTMQLDFPEEHPEKS